jgi:hypothetical protein
MPVRSNYQQAQALICLELSFSFSLQPIASVLSSDCSHVHIRDFVKSNVELTVRY